jgi:hypothetical protein
VADGASTPTLIVGPAALRWLRRFAQSFSSPPGVLRRVWKLQPHGAPKKCRHPLAKALPRVVNRVTVTAHADNLRVVHPTESSDDPARGLALHVSGLGLRATLTPAPPAPPPPRRARRALRRNVKLPPATVPGLLEVELEEVRVLLPPEDTAAAAAEEADGGGDLYGQTVRGTAALTPGCQMCYMDQPIDC